VPESHVLTDINPVPKEYRALHEWKEYDLRHRYTKSEDLFNIYFATKIIAASE